jgi:hypothetical protein
VYTRFVDDLAISAPFDLERSGFPGLVERILQKHGFDLNPTKHKFGRISEGIEITKIRVTNGHPDVRKDYSTELERQLEDARSLARGEKFNGPYFTQAQIRGRVQFVCWVNPKRRFALRKKFRSIDWNGVDEEARKRGLIAARPVICKTKEATDTL